MNLQNNIISEIDESSIVFYFEKLNWSIGEIADSLNISEEMVENALTNELAKYIKN